MKIVGMMMVKNEQWVLRASLDAACRWCDSVVVWDDGSTDDTKEICLSNDSGRVHYHETPGSDQWDEMDRRDEHLKLCRAIGATHLAIIDADEILTYNNIPNVRGWFEKLAPGECLDVPMIPMRSLHQYQDDNSVWSRAKVTLGFRDDQKLTHRPRGDGYQHHNRTPSFCIGRLDMYIESGGVMHLQFAHEKRLLAKHVLYRMVDHIRWPRRESVQQLNWKFDQALQPPGKLTDVPVEWWGQYPMELIDVHDEPYQNEQINALLEKHGREAFTGLDLKGY